MNFVDREGRNFPVPCGTLQLLQIQQQYCKGTYRHGKEAESTYAPIITFNWSPGVNCMPAPVKSEMIDFVRRQFVFKTYKILMSDPTANHRQLTRRIISMVSFD